MKFPFRYTSLLESRPVITLISFIFAFFLGVIFSECMAIDRMGVGGLRGRNIVPERHEMKKVELGVVGAVHNFTASQRTPFLAESALAKTPLEDYVAVGVEEIGSRAGQLLLQQENSSRAFKESGTSEFPQLHAQITKIGLADATNFWIKEGMKHNFTKWLMLPPTQASEVVGVDRDSPLCSLSGPDHWLVCRDAILEKLGWRNMTCPDACVSFEEYGRFNNNMIQLSNTMLSFLDPVMIEAVSRRSVVLDGFWKNRFGNIIDVKYLEKMCVFPSWGRGARNLAKCKRLDGAVAFRGDSLPKKKKTSLLPIKTLIISWVFLGAVSNTARAQVDAQIANLGDNFSAMHARFLEGECASRHQRNNWSSAICTLKPGYVPTQMKILGHSKQAFVVNPRPKP